MKNRNKIYKTSIRFYTAKDIARLSDVLSQYPNEKPATVFRKLILANKKPVLSKAIREELYILTIELNCTGRNLNQLLKYQIFDEINIKETIFEIKSIVKKIDEKIFAYEH